MRVFLTGATGFIGSAVIAELLRAGHEVTGLARSAQAEEQLAAAGARAHRGSLDDPASLAAGAADADGVIHLAFIHDFSRYAESGQIEGAAVEAMAAALVGTDKPLVITSGTMVLRPGSLGLETDEGDATGPGAPRLAGESVIRTYADRGVRGSVVRLAPSVHNRERAGFAGVLEGIARSTGISGYVGDGSNRWPAVHRDDAARLFRLALEHAPAGAVLHGVGEEGVPVIDIATAISTKAGTPLQVIEPQRAGEHFGFLAGAIGADMPASNARTRELLGWEPTQPGLIDDLLGGAPAA